MVTALQNKNTTTITISKRLTKSELERVIKYLNCKIVKPREDIKKVMLTEMADEITEGAWQRFLKERGKI